MSDEDKKGSSHREEWERRNREYQAAQDTERIRAERERQRNINQRLGRIVDPMAKEILEEEQKIQSIARQKQEQVNLTDSARQAKKAAQLQKRQAQRAKRQAQKQAKQNQRQARKIQKQENREQTRKARRHLARLIPVFLCFMFLTVISAYFISPYGKMKQFIVSGSDHQDQAKVIAATKVDERDYTITVLTNRKNLAKRIQKASPWVRQVSVGYQFPTTFPIQIEEYAIVAYQIENQKAFPILANGQKVDEEVAEHEMPSDAIRTQLADEELYPTLSEQLLQLNQEVRENIQEIKSSASKASEDLVTLTMRDGHQVLVPLSELSRKLTYYPSIVKNLQEPTMIDMEAGAYGYPMTSDEKTAQESGLEMAVNQVGALTTVTQN